MILTLCRRGLVVFIFFEFILGEDIRSLLFFLTLAQRTTLAAGLCEILVSVCLRDVLSRRLIWLLLGGLVACLIRRRFYSRMLWWSLAFILFFSFSVRRLFIYYLLFELSLIPIALIILFNGRQPERLSSIMYFLVYTCRLSIPYLALLVIFLPRIYFYSGVFFSQSTIGWQFSLFYLF